MATVAAATDPNRTSKANPTRPDHGASSPSQASSTATPRRRRAGPGPAAVQHLARELQNRAREHDAEGPESEGHDLPPRQLGSDDERIHLGTPQEPDDQTDQGEGEKTTLTEPVTFQMW
jgi:hypothetical protein